MKKTIMAATALTFVAGSSIAGGIDRSGQGINLLFEEGTVAQTSFARVDPNMTGTFGGTESGDMARAYNSPGLGFKMDLNDSVGVALLYEQPFGADVLYAPDYALSDPSNADQAGGQADLHSLTALLRYKMQNGFSVYGGLRAQSLNVDIALPAVPYSVESNTQTDLGYVVGAAWEKPEIAARVALTYNSKIKHDLTVIDVVGGVTQPPSAASVETPQSVNLDFQTGVAPNTLVFGTIRWAEWSKFSYAPPNYPRGTLLQFKNNSTTYSLGVGRRFSEAFSGAITVGYEKANGDTVSDLGPADGAKSIGLAGTYTRGNTKFSAGVRYVKLGDATTNAGARFTDNDGWVVGFQVTHKFN
ncbi:transporter [Cognatishimia activa]|uniref:transporter n=1 Tax=Cognatishimia activa TaxID=1715691 RepID=UPI00222E8FBD|nr:transporter [Cognatishimia activa]UZD91476.1 transporter [Cognatishimia activa]